MDKLCIVLRDRTFEFHPHWPPLLKFVYGSALIRITKSAIWQPEYRCVCTTLPLHGTQMCGWWTFGLTGVCVLIVSRARVPCYGLVFVDHGGPPYLQGALWMHIAAALVALGQQDNMLQR